ncbi:hypothetical protein P170DRAFT_358376, partial [Aspergillus steynii IBT 23096]
EIIKKGIVLLDLVKLLIFKGPLNKFIIAKKVIPKVFMKKINYRLSFINKCLYYIFWKQLSEI